MSEGRQLNIRVNLDTGRLERDASRAQSLIKGIGDETEMQGRRMAGVFKAIGAGIAANFAAERIKGFISQIVNVRAEVQALGVSFETLLGSRTKAEQLMGQIRQYAASTPMQVNDLAQGAQTLLGFNIEASKVMPIMKSIGDISMGNRDNFNSLTLAFAQMSATGKLMGQDFMQMVNAGFNPLMVMSEKTGKSMETLKDEMSAGSISAKMVEEAFMAATAEGGKFHGMLEAQSRTIRGALSNLQGAFSDMLNDFGESSEGIINKGINAAYGMVKNYKETGEAILWTIGALGMYKAVVVGNEALEAAALDTLHAKVAAIGEVNAAEATGFELKVQEAVATRELSKAEAEELLMQYELAKARVAELNALKLQTKAEAESAMAVQAATAAKVQAAEEQVVAANMKYEAALRSADGERIERAELALGTAQSELNAASKAHQAAMTETAAATKRANIAATTAETAAQELNTLSMEKGTKATGFLTLAKTQLRAAVSKLYATMTAHPYALLAAAVVALGYGIYKLVTYETEAEKAQKRLNAAHAEAQGVIATEKADIDRLFDALKEAKKGTEEYQKAKDAIWSKYGNYLKQLGDETTALNDQAAAYELVRRKAEEAALAKYKDQVLDDIKNRNIEEMGVLYEQAYQLVVEKKGKVYADKNIEAIRRVVSGDTKVNPEFLKLFGEHGLLGGYKNPLFNVIQQGQLTMQKTAEQKAEAERKFGYISDPGEGDAEVTVNFSKEYAKAKKEMDAKEAAWKKLAASKTATKKEVEEAKKAYDSAKTSYESLHELATGKKTDKQTGQTEEEKAAAHAAALRKEADLGVQQLRERNQALLRYDAELEQARIDIMEDGSEKRRRQRELDNAKELADLRERMQADIDAEISRQKAVFDAHEDAMAAGKKHYAKRTFDPGDISALSLQPGQSIGEDVKAGNVSTAEINAITAKYDVLFKLLAAKQAKADEDMARAERLAMQEYLQDYGTYEEKKTAIAALYAEKRAKATTEAERMRLTREEGKALADLDFEDLMGNRAALAFGEIENLSRETIARLIEDLEKYRGEVTKTFDPDKIGKYNEALTRLRKAQSTAQAPGQDGIFGTIVSMATPSFFRERKAAMEEIADMQRTLDDLNAAKTLAKTEDEMRRIDSAIADTETSLKRLKAEFEGKFGGVAATLKATEAIVRKVNEEIEKTRELIDDLASTADALGADTEIGSGWDKASTLMQGFVESSAGVTEAFESLKSGNIMGVVSGITKSFTSWINAFTAIHDRSRERTIKRLQEELDELERINRRIEHNREGTYSKESAGYYKEEVANLQKQSALIRQQIMAEKDKKKSDDARIKEWEEQLEELTWQIQEYKDAALDAILGEDIGTSIDNFADRLAESWGRAGDRARAAKDYVKTMLRQMVTEAMKTDLTGPIQQLREQMARALDDDVITQKEQEELEAFARQLAEKTQQQYAWADKIMNDGVSDSGRGTSGTFATASQDSVDELSGRAAAILTSGEMRREALLGIGIDMAAVRAQVAANAETAAEMRELQLIAVGHLEAIARNTNELYEMNARLDRIERNTRGL